MKLTAAFLGIFTLISMGPRGASCSTGEVPPLELTVGLHGYNLKNISKLTVTNFQLGCLNKAKKIVLKFEAKNVSLPPDYSTGQIIIDGMSDAEVCDRDNATLAVLHVKFLDDTCWKNPVVVEEKQKPEELARL